MSCLGYCLLPPTKISGYAPAHFRQADRTCPGTLENEDIAPLPFEKGGRGAFSQQHHRWFHYQHRLETNLLQLLAHSENSECFFIIVFVVNIVDEQKQTKLVKFPLLSTLYCLWTCWCPTKNICCGAWACAWAHSMRRETDSIHTTSVLVTFSLLRNVLLDQQPKKWIVYSANRVKSQNVTLGQVG